MDINGLSCLAVFSSFQLEENRGDGREAGQGTASSGSLLVASAVCVPHGDHISWQGALCTERSLIPVPPTTHLPFPFRIMTAACWD